MTVSTVWFSTVVRGAPIDRGGELVKLDWRAKKVLARVTIRPENPALVDPNPRGNTRGGRGIRLLDREVMVGSYHSLCFFDRDLAPQRALSHGLMVSLHETVSSGAGRIVVASTALDAALEFDLGTGALLRSWWPREMESFQRALGLAPLPLDKAADNRGAFLSSAHTEHPHHVHLNAVAFHRGELLALFSKTGAICNLDRGTVLVRDKALEGAHNLLVDERGVATCNHTVGRGVLRFDLDAGRRLARLGYGDDPQVVRLARGAELRYRLQRLLLRLGLRKRSASRPLFARGLAAAGASLFVGVAPATILELDARSGALRDLFTFSTDMDACVHGLEVEG